ncbi:MAG: phage portal protein [Lachnospiraceae bacterium]|nr:phage portal protein [Lachnospiraceae bacterium]
MPVIQRLKNLFGRNVFYMVTPEEMPQVGKLTARQLYATQANLHAVVSFLADSVAQLPLKVYIRDDENSRRRDRDSVAAKLLWRPNADQTAYEFINALSVELLLMGCAVIWLLPDPDSESGYQLRIIPREWIVDTERATNYAPDILKVHTGAGQFIDIPRTEFVQFRMYSPGNPGGYQSPIAALRQTLNEQIEADRFRTQIYKSSGRFNAYITRPKDVQPWDDETKRKWLTAFREGWGADGSNSGKMPLLEDGMEIKPYAFNAKEAQYAETKQLSREDVAAAFHVNPSLIWHTTTQTYASAKDNARALYADCLGPTLQMLQQRINSFLLPMVGADPRTYVEFDLTEKLKGSFEERASILQASVGGPWLTRNEARADNNLPPIEGGDELIVPLNVIEGGQSSPQDTHMEEQEPVTTEPAEPQKMRKKAEAEKIRVKARSTKEEDEQMAEILQKFWKRQANSVLPKLGAKSASWWDEDRWNEELAEDINPLINSIADAHGKETAKAIGFEYDSKRTRKYLEALAKGRAQAINEATYRKLQRAMEDDEDDEDTPASVFDTRQNKDSLTFGRMLALTAAGWAATHEAPKQARDAGISRTVEKMWITGDNPRPEHAMMDGETVPIDQAFSNGCEWPGDEGGDPDTTCGCNCSTEVIITY